jgi:hypothetical protein
MLSLTLQICLQTDKSDGAYGWVVTRSAHNEVMFWDAVNGTRHTLPLCPPPTISPSAAAQNSSAAASAAGSTSSAANAGAGFPFRKVHCVFNHQNVWASVQRSDAVHTTDYRLEQPALWKAMNPQVMALVTAATHQHLGGATTTASTASDFASRFVLLPNRIDLLSTAQSLERELQALVHTYRCALTPGAAPQHTAFDDRFGYVLAPALSAYEHERLMGVCYGNAEFQQAVKRAVPQGYVFKGVPLQVTPPTSLTFLWLCSRACANACFWLLFWCAVYALQCTQDICGISCQSVMYALALDFLHHSSAMLMR